MTMKRYFFKTFLLAAFLVGLSLPAAAEDDDQVVLTFQKGPGRAFMFEDNPVIIFEGDNIKVKRTDVEPVVYNFDSVRTITFGHLKGDFTNDGILDIKDVNEIIKNKAAGQTADDVNGDGKVDVADILYIIKQLAE